MKRPVDWQEHAAGGAQLSQSFHGGVTRSSPPSPAAQTWSLGGVALQAKRCLEVVQPPGGDKFGMCMSLALFRRDNVVAPYLAVGYEDGRLAIWRLDPHLPAAAGSSSSGSRCASSSGGTAAQRPQFQHRPLFAAKLHNEPLMALAVSASGTGELGSFAEFHLLRARSYWCLLGSLQSA